MIFHLSKIIIFVVLVIIFAILSIFSLQRKSENTSAQLQIKTKSGSFNYIFEKAITLEEHEKGLMNRETINDNFAMLFIYDKIGPKNFWMKNTLIPLDIIFIDENKKVIKIFKNAIPNNDIIIYSSPANCMYVLEVKAGTSDRINLEENDIIIW